MNGLMDARLELLSRDDHDAVMVKIRTSAPAGMSRWALYRHRIHSRRALLELTDGQLRDIGLDFRQARAEAMKPFWRE
jgi:uncharacterized protein YjiS (DUF1127 family)